MRVMPGNRVSDRAQGCAVTIRYSCILNGCWVCAGHLLESFGQRFLALPFGHKSVNVEQGAQLPSVLSEPLHTINRMFVAPHLVRQWRSTSNPLS
jgi:hypothetical protein